MRRGEMDKAAAGRKRLSRAERDVLRERISSAVRVRELADAETWKEIKANGRAAARQRHWSA
jgi:hypothetical protein